MYSASRSISPLYARSLSETFIFRPSGTEDVVRVYAECEDASQVNKLAVEVAGLVYDYAGGRGERASLDKL